MEGEAYSSMNLLWFARKQCLNTPPLAIEKPLSGTSPLLSLFFFLLRHGPLLELPSVPFTQTLNISMKNALHLPILFHSKTQKEPHLIDHNLQRMNAIKKYVCNHGPGCCRYKCLEIHIFCLSDAAVI